jgi:hypothetical protein
VCLLDGTEFNITTSQAGYIVLLANLFADFANFLGG